MNSGPRHLATGAAGEALAKEYFERLHWPILATNVHLGKKEIDLIARDGETVVFVEVKARRSNAFGRPEEAITEKKLALLHQAVALYVRHHPEVHSVRLDVIAIEYSDNPAVKPRLKHLRGIDGGRPLAIPD